METKLPLTLMVISKVSSDNDVMPSHVFTEGLRLNSDDIVGLLAHGSGKGGCRVQDHHTRGSRTQESGLLRMGRS